MTPETPSPEREPSQKHATVQLPQLQLTVANAPAPGILNFPVTLGILLATLTFLAGLGGTVTKYTWDRMDKLEARMDRVESKLDKLADAVAALAVQTGRLEEKLDARLPSRPRVGP